MAKEVKNKWAKMLSDYEDVLDYSIDGFSEENIIRSNSPYINWTFANKTHGLPKGAGILLSGPPKAGKSFLSKSFVAQIHKENPEAVTLEINTEMRSKWQSGDVQGIDKSRHIVKETNEPAKIFDFIKNDVKAMLDDGMPLGLVIIDSLSGIQGIKRQNADSIEQHLMGDQALTIGTGLDMIIPIFRKYNVPWIATAQVRANLDAGTHGPKFKTQASNKTLHSLEYFMNVRRANAADDKTDIEGNKFEDDSVKDARGNKDITGHKIYVTMEQSSLGTAGRAGIITIDYSKGIVNQHEELFTLGYNTGVIKREGTSRYTFGDFTVIGKANFAAAIKENEALGTAILKEVMAKDA